jgi:hypothetical protein
MPSELRLDALLPYALDPAAFSTSGLSHLNWASFPPSGEHCNSEQKLTLPCDEINQVDD